MNGEFAAAWVALGGTLIVLIYNMFDRSRSAFDELMSQATGLLTGKTQRRSAGIAIIEGSQRRLIRRKRTWLVAVTGLLSSQAVYLLQSSRSGERQDEIFNLKRILELLIKFQSHLSDRAPFTELIEILKEPAETGEPGKEDRGLNRSAIKKMFGDHIFDGWAKDLSGLCRAGNSGPAAATLRTAPSAQAQPPRTANQQVNVPR